MKCREYLGERGYCHKDADRGSWWCLDHIAERQLWEQRMGRIR